MIRAFCVLLCLMVLPSCGTTSNGTSKAGNLLMMPVRLGTGIINMAKRTVGMSAAADSEAPKEGEPKPHLRLDQVPRDAEKTTEKLAAIGTMDERT